MTTYDKIMEIVDDFKNIETIDEIKNHPKYKEYMEDHVHYNGFDFVQFNSKHLFKFCNYFVIEFAFVEKIRMMQFCISYNWLVGYNFHKQKINYSSYFDDDDFDIKNMDEIDEVIFRTKLVFERGKKFS